jgi:hypothetical protein
MSKKGITKKHCRMGTMHTMRSGSSMPLVCAIENIIVD